MPAPITGQVNLSGTAQPLSAAPVGVVAYTIKAPITNLTSIFIGNSTVTSSTGYQMDPGETFDYSRSDQHGEARLQLNPSDFYAVGTSPDKVTWLASPS